MSANKTEILVVSTARTTTPAVASISKPQGAQGIVVVVDVTALTSTPAITPTLQVLDPVKGLVTWVTFTAITNITGTGTYFYVIYPGAVETSGPTAVLTEVMAVPVPLDTAWLMTHGDSDSITYSISVHYVS